jgi:hypothetical protein
MDIYADGAFAIFAECRSLHLSAPPFGISRCPSRMQLNNTAVPVKPPPRAN